MDFFLLVKCLLLDYENKMINVNVYFLIIKLLNICLIALLSIFKCLIITINETTFKKIVVSLIFTKNYAGISLCIKVFFIQHRVLLIICFSKINIQLN